MYVYLLYILQVFHYVQFFKETSWKITLSQRNFVIYGVYGDSVLTEVPCPHYCLPPKNTHRMNHRRKLCLRLSNIIPKWSLRFQLNCYRIELAVCPNPADFKEHWALESFQKASANWCSLDSPAHYHGCGSCHLWVSQIIRNKYVSDEV